MSKELLIPISKEVILQAFESGEGIEKIIEDVRTLVKNFKHDLTTDKGRKATISFAANIASMKVSIDGMRKDSIEDRMAVINVVNKSGKQLRDSFDLLRDEARKPVTDWENTEKERVENLEERVCAIKDLSDKWLRCLNPRLSELIEDEARLAELDIDSSFEEYELEAVKKKEKSLEVLNTLIKNKKEEIAKETELEQLRKEKEEREKKDRDEKLKKEAAEKATREAEERAKKETDRIEREKQEAIDREERAKIQAEESERKRIEAEERAKIEKEQAEQRRIDDEKLAEIKAKEAAEQARQDQIRKQKEKEANEKAALAKREADRAHTGEIRREAKECLMQFVDETVAKKIVLAIDQGRIKNVTINY